MAAARVLARAFQEDPVMLHLLPDPAARAKALPHLFRPVVRYGMRRGRVQAAADGGAIAVWVDPTGVPVPLSAMLRLGMAAWPFRLGGGPFVRAMRVMDGMDRVHGRHADGAHAYLWAMGVEPHRQGKGLGSALLSVGLSDLNARGLPCYLETFQPRNVPLYERFGFRVVDEVANVGGGPRMWSMRREPPGPSAR